MNIWQLIALLKKAPKDILKEIEELLDDHEHGRHRRARRLIGKFTWCGISVQGEHLVITEPLVVGQSVADLVSAVKADGSPSAAVLSNVTYTPADPTVATAAVDPNTPNGAIINAIGAGTTVLNYSATATEADGTAHTITGADTIVVTAAAPPPPLPAVALVGNFGTPFPTPPTPPPAP